MVEADCGRFASTLLTKNRATSFGLTLVVGLPFARSIRTRAAHLQARIEALLPGRFHWYEPDHLHATVMALLRGRYRESPPLRRDELPADLEGLLGTLNHFFGRLPPFPLDLDRLQLAPDRRMLALGADPSGVRQRVVERLASFPGLDRPKDLDGWHVTLGCLQTPTPFATEAEQAGFEARWAELQASSLGSMVVDRVWLVHYADRTLGRLVGKAPLRLGRPNTHSAASLMGALGIAWS